MSGSIHERTGKHQWRRGIFNGKYSFDYVTLSLESEKEVNLKSSTTNCNDLGTSEKKKRGKHNVWRKEFAKKLQSCVVNREVQERLRILTRSQLDWITPCYKTPTVETNSAVRRRCFCENIGPKFCEMCRRKISKELCYRVPKIICDLKESGSKSSMLKRAQYFVTPEPRFSDHLKQASIFYKLEGNKSSPDNQATLDTCLNTEKSRNHAISRGSSFSSLTSLKDHEFFQDITVHSLPHNTPNTSPDVIELPHINNPNCSMAIHNTPNTSPDVTELPDINNSNCSMAIHNQHVFTSTVSDANGIVQNSPVTTNYQQVLLDNQNTPLKTIASDQDVAHNPHVLNNVLQHHEIGNGSNACYETSSNSQMFHITHQLRSIKELKADKCSPTNTESQSISTLIYEQPSSCFSNSKKENTFSVTSLSSSDGSCKSLESGTKRGVISEKSRALPRLPHPVEPVLLELKYINFSIYDYDCSRN